MAWTCLIPPRPAATTQVSKLACCGPDGRGARVRMPPILRVARQPVKAMSVADAARAIEAGGDGVVVFRDLETATVSVLYRRQNGELTLVETEV